MTAPLKPYTPDLQDSNLFNAFLAFAQTLSADFAQMDIDDAFDDIRENKQRVTEALNIWAHSLQTWVNLCEAQAVRRAIETAHGGVRNTDD